jgi:hypothetical protein
MLQAEAYRSAQPRPLLETPPCGEKVSPRPQFAKKIVTGIALTASLATAAVGGWKTSENLPVDIPVPSTYVQLDESNASPEKLHDIYSFGGERTRAGLDAAPQTKSNEADYSATRHPTYIMAGIAQKHLGNAWTRSLYPEPTSIGSYG